MQNARHKSDSLIRSQRRIFAALKAEVRRLMGPTPPAIAAYERSYRKTFASLLRHPSLEQAAITHTQFLDQLQDADFICVGDFHTDPQSQKIALRLLRALHARDHKAQWHIGIEMIPSHHQKWVDRFMLGAITEEDFLFRIRFREEWGFPWENYAPLFYWARQNQVRIQALNRPKALRSTRARGGKVALGERPEEDLRERDLWAAGVLVDRWSGAMSRQRFLVLYGEMHVAQPHLPEAIRKVSTALNVGKKRARPRCVSVFSNFDELYFKWARLGKDSSSEILQISPLSYCLMASTPWGKLQSAINWFEGGFARETKPESLTALQVTSPSRSLVDLDLGDPESDSTPDDLSHLERPLEWFSQFFNVSVPALDQLQWITMHNADQMEALIQSPQLTRLEKQALRYHWMHNQRVYCAPLTLAYLGSPSPNTYAEMAALHLFKNSPNGPANRRMLIAGQEGLGHLIVDSFFGFLGSLLLNPKRKCDYAKDHAKRHRALRHQKATPTSPEEPLMRALTLKLLTRLDHPEAMRAYLDRSFKIRMSAVLACRQVGKILAKNLYPQVVQGKISPTQLQALFLKPISTQNRIRWLEQFLKAHHPQHHKQSKLDHF